MPVVLCCRDTTKDSFKPIFLDLSWDIASSHQGYRKFETVQYNGILNPKLSDETRKILRHFDKVN